MTTGLANHPEVRQDFELRFMASTPVHVGGLGADTVTDLPLATDGQGRLVIPGSSWAGVLRELARRYLTSAEEALFGFQKKEAPAEGHASRLFVADTPVGVDAGRVELRTGVGIDRRWGAAAHQIVYDRLVLAAGTPLILYLRYEGPDGTDAHRLVEIVRALGLRIGAASSRGLGRLTCVEATVHSVDLRSRSSLLTALGGQVEPTPVPPAADVDGAIPRIELAWRTRRPVLVGGPSPGEKADLVPLLIRSTDGRGLVPVLPGSSVKGVLRSLAERVLRTLIPDEVPRPGRGFVEAMSTVGKGAPAFEVLFGSREQAGALSVPDTSAVAEPVGDDAWRRYLEGQPLTAGWSHERTHVAIDRWTGGAAESRLFTVQETAGVRWQPLRLELDARRLAQVPEERRLGAVLLLGVAVGLLRDGLAGVGHGTTRGLGEIEVTGIAVHGAVQWGVSPYPEGGDWWAWLRDLSGGLGLEWVKE